MKTTLDRFNKSRWSATRWAIYNLGDEESCSFPAKEYFNAHSSVQRLNDAYRGDKVWEIGGGHSKPFVKRIK